MRTLYFIMTTFFVGVLTAMLELSWEIRIAVIVSVIGAMLFFEAVIKEAVVKESLKVKQ